MGVANLHNDNPDIVVVGLPLDDVAIVGFLELKLLELLLDIIKLSSLVAVESNDVLLGLEGVVAELGNLVVDKSLAGGKHGRGNGQKTCDGKGSPHFGLCTGS